MRMIRIEKAVNEWGWELISEQVEEYVLDSIKGEVGIGWELRLENEDFKSRMRWVEWEGWGCRMRKMSNISQGLGG